MNKGIETLLPRLYIAREICWKDALMNKGIGFNRRQEAGSIELRDVGEFAN